MTEQERVRSGQCQCGVTVVQTVVIRTEQGSHVSRCECGQWVTVR